MARHAAIQLSLRAVIGEYEFRDVSGYAANFALNSIPAATLRVASGRNVVTQQLATIHNAIHTLHEQLPAEVFLTVRVISRDRAVVGLPENTEFKIFSGDVVGTGWHRTDSDVGMTLHLIHFLGQLNYASAVSASSHPGNPADFSYPSAFRLVGPESGNLSGGADLNANTSWVPMISRSVISAAGLADLWGNILHYWMVQISQSSAFDFNMAGEMPGPANLKILAALDRFKPNPAGVPLRVDTQDADAVSVLSGICDALNDETGSSWLNNTLWGKIIGDWAPEYLFAVVPRVDDALAVPFAGGLRGGPWATVKTSDYNSARVSRQLHHVLRGVGIVHPILDTMGSDLGKTFAPLNLGGLSGYYSPSQDLSGMTLLKVAPRWLRDPIRSYSLSREVEGMDGVGISTSVDEILQNAPAETKTGTQIAQAVINYRGIMNKYAEHLYMQQRLNGSVGEVVGKLRYDISPGSNILVQAGQSAHIAEEDGIIEDIYATVAQVSYVIDAENNSGGTSLTLSHIRTDAENNQPGMSVARAPLYQDTWLGATMLTHDGIQPQN